MTDGDGFFDHAYDISTSEETLEHYARFAEVYDEEVTREGYVQPVRTVEMLRRFEPPADASILDVGCGTGLSGVALRDAGFTEVLDLGAIGNAYEVSGSLKSSNRATAQ